MNYAIGARSNPSTFYEIIQMLIDADFDNVQTHATDCGTLPLPSWVFMDCNLPCARLLIRSGVLHGDYDRGSRHAPLQVAIGQGNLEVLPALLEFYKLGFHHGSALDMAAECQSIEALEMLIEHGARLNRLNSAGTSSALHQAAKNNPAALRYLLDIGAVPNLKIKYDGSTPLHWAAYHGARSCMEILLEHGVVLEATDNFGKTALLIAIERAIPQQGELTLEWLLKHRVDAKARDNMGRSALHILVLKAASCYWAFQDINGQACTNFIRCLIVVLEHGADPSEMCPTIAPPEQRKLSLGSIESQVPRILRRTNEEILKRQPALLELYLESIKFQYGEAVAFVDGELYWDAQDCLPDSLSQSPSHGYSPLRLGVKPIFEPPDNPAMSITVGPYRDPRVFDDGWMARYTYRWDSTSKEQYMCMTLGSL